jgi:hypothetical protein
VSRRHGHLHYVLRWIGEILSKKARPSFVETLDVAPAAPLVAIYFGEHTVAADFILKRPAQGR